MKKIITLLAIVFCLQVNAQIISTIAGNGTAGFSGDGGQATNAEFYGASGISSDAFGNIYIADSYNNRIRKINTMGIISTIAGSGAAGFSGDGGQASIAKLHNPSSVIADYGDLYIADAGNERIRKIGNTGFITTIAGNGIGGYSGDGGIATNAELGDPVALAGDPVNSLFIADLGNNCIRLISGPIYTAAGNGVAGFSGDGGQATNANLYAPYGIAYDYSSGNLYISDEGNNRIRKVDASGIITTIAGNGQANFSGDGGQATAATLYSPTAMALDAAGNLYVADEGNKRIRKIDNTGIITTIAGNGIAGFSGDGGAATAAKLNGPAALNIDAVGNIYISDYNNNRIRKITPPLAISVNSYTVCPGTSTTITLSASGANTYTWSTGETADSILVTPTITTTYTVIGIRGDSMGLAISTVTVKNPTVTVNSPIICLGNMAALTASGANNYTWNTSTIGATINVSPTITTHYTVTGTDANGCVNTATSTVTVNPLPNINLISDSVSLCLSDTATLTASGANTYTWSTNDIGTAIAISPSVTTTYSVMGTGANGCINTATITQTVTNCSAAGINQLSANSERVSIYPNPANTIINLELKMQNVSNKAKYILYDVNGKIVKQSLIYNPQSLIDISAVPEGIFNLSIINNEGVINKRVIIVR